MAFWDKLAFWKKDDDFGLADLEKEFGSTSSSFDSNQSGYAPQDSYTAPDPAATDRFGGSPNYGQPSAYGADSSLESSSPMGNNAFSSQSFGQQSQQSNFPSFSQRTPAASTSPSPSAPMGKDIELISSKLDAIKAQLATVERIALSEEQKSSKRQRAW